MTELIAYTKEVVNWEDRLTKLVEQKKQELSHIPGINNALDRLHTSLKLSMTTIDTQCSARNEQSLRGNTQLGLYNRTMAQILKSFEEACTKISKEYSKQSNSSN